MAQLLAILLPLLTFTPLGLLPPEGASTADRNCRIVDSFEAYEDGAIPYAWKELQGRSLQPVSEEMMRPSEYFRIRTSNSRTYVRAHTENEVVRIIRRMNEGEKWNIHTHPHLTWEWRALELPPNAREDESDVNDTAAAVYVTFSVNFLGLPKSIKYTYSSTLKPGTVVSYRGLKVIVVDSGPNRQGEWLTVRRNVREDYRKVYGEPPPAHPISIALWSDSDSTHEISTADFDNIRVCSDLK